MTEPTIANVRTIVGHIVMPEFLLEDCGLKPATFERQLERYGYATVGTSCDRALQHSENRHSDGWDATLDDFLNDWTEDLDEWPRDRYRYPF